MVTPLASKIISMLEQGMRPADIKKSTGCGGSVISHYRKQLNIPKFKPGLPPMISEERLNKITTMRNDGLTLKAIGAAFGVSDRRIQQILTPEKHRARVMIYNQILRNKIMKPTHCQDCKQQKPLQAHHMDYSKPDLVDWLCSECHGLRHREHTSNLFLRCLTSEKARWVRAANARRMKLSAWVREVLNSRSGQ